MNDRKKQKISSYMMQYGTAIPVSKCCNDPKKYVITQEELDLLERARLELLEICDGNSPLHNQLLFVTEPVRSKLWKIVNRKRDEVK